MNIEIRKVDAIDKILITAVNGKPGDEWPERVKDIYWSRLSTNARVVAAKQAIMNEVQMQPAGNIAEQIRSMGPKSKLYKVLKRELTARGWWKNKPRGLPSADHFRKSY